MDDPGPYLDSSSHDHDKPSADIRMEEEWERRVQGPEKPSFLRSKSPDDHWYKETLDGRGSSSEPQSKKEKRKSEKKEKRDKKKEKDVKKSKHRHHKSRRRE
jgi:hypothetical protein